MSTMKRKGYFFVGMLPWGGNVPTGARFVVMKMTMLNTWMYFLTMGRKIHAAILLKYIRI